MCCSDFLDLFDWLSREISFHEVNSVFAPEAYVVMIIRAKCESEFSLSFREFECGIGGRYQETDQNTHTWESLVASMSDNSRTVHIKLSPKNPLIPIATEELAKRAKLIKLY